MRCKNFSIKRAFLETFFIIIIIIYTQTLWMSTRKCGFIKNFVRAVAVLSKVIFKNHQTKLSVYNVLERLRIAPDGIFETLHEHSYDYMCYLKDAKYGHSMDTICISVHIDYYISYMNKLPY